MFCNRQDDWRLTIFPPPMTRIILKAGTDQGHVTNDGCTAIIRTGISCGPHNVPLLLINVSQPPLTAGRKSPACLLPPFVFFPFQIPYFFLRMKFIIFLKNWLPHHWEKKGITSSLGSVGEF